MQVDDDDDELDLSQMKKPKKHKEVSFSADLTQDDKSLLGLTIYNIYVLSMFLPLLLA